SLAIREMHGPLNVGARGRDLGCRSVIMVRKDAKARRLALHAALRILKAARGLRLFVQALRADEELIRAVADPRDADRGMNLVNVRHGQLHSSAALITPTHDGSAAAHACGNAAACKTRTRSNIRAAHDHRGPDIHGYFLCLRKRSFSSSSPSNSHSVQGMFRQNSSLGFTS